MKIAVITNLYPPISRGGAEKVAQRIVGELVRRGHQVVVVTTMPLSSLDALLPLVRESIGEKVYRFFPLNLYHVLSDHRVPYFIRAFWHLIDLFSPLPAGRIEKIFRVEKPDIVLTHNLKGISLHCTLAARRLKLPWIHTIHDIQLSIASGLLLKDRRFSLLESLFRRPYEFFVRRAIGTPNLVISPSKFLADFYRRRGFFNDTEIRIVPNPAPDFSLPDYNRQPSGPLRLLFAGQLERHKGILDLLEIINLLDIPVELHVAGNGSFSSLVEEQSKKDPRIIYHGFVSSNNLENLFALVDATVVPSSCFENSPTIIYESLQSGVPVLASDIGGVGELIRQGNNGYLVEPGNIEVWVKTIKTFASEKQIFRQRCEAIRASMAPYSLTAYVDKLELVMEGLVKGKRE